MNVNEQLIKQKSYLSMHGPLSFSDRIEALKRLKEAIKKYEPELMRALKEDLGKPDFESYTAEIGFLYTSIDYTLKRLKKWMRPRRVRSESAQLIGSSTVYASAYGVVFIFGAFYKTLKLFIFKLIWGNGGGNF